MPDVPILLRLEIPHPGIDTKRVTGAARLELAEIVKTEALAGAHLQRWPHPATVSLAEVELVAYDTKKCAGETLEVIVAQLGKWVANGPRAVAIVKTRIEKDGKGARLELVIQASDIREREAVDPGGSDPQRCAYCSANNLRAGECPFCSAPARDPRGRRVAPELREHEDGRLAHDDAFAGDARLPGPTNDDVPIEGMTDAQKARLLQREAKIKIRGSSRSHGKKDDKHVQGGSGLLPIISSGPGRPTIEDEVRQHKNLRITPSNEQTLKATGLNLSDLTAIFAQSIRDRTIAIVNGELIAATTCAPAVPDAIVGVSDESGISYHENGSAA